MLGNRDWILLLAANFFARLSYELVRSPALPLFVVSLGGSAAWVGLIGSVAGWVGLLARLPGGVLADVAGTRRMMLWGGALFAAGPAAYPWLGSLPAVLAVRVGHAVAPALFTPASASEASRAWPMRAGEGLAWVSGVKAAASVVGGFLAGALLDRFGFGRLFWAAGLVGVAVPLLVRGMAAGESVQSSRRVAVRGDRGQDAAVRAAWGSAAAALRDLVLWRAAFGGMAAIAAQAAFYSFVPVYGHAHGWPAPWLGGLVGGHFGALALASPWAGRLADRRGWQAASRLGLACGAAGLLAFAAAPSVASAAVAAAGTALAVAVAGPAAAAGMLDATRHGRGATMGLWASALDLGEALGGLLTGLVASAAGVPWALAAWGAALSTMAVALPRIAASSRGRALVTASRDA